MTLRGRAVVLVVIALATIVTVAWSLLAATSGLLDAERAYAAIVAEAPDGQSPSGRVDDELRATASTVAQRTHVLVLSLAIGFTALAGLIAGFAWLTWAWVLRPLLAVRRSAARSAHPAGLAAPIEAVGPPEIRDLAVASERLRREVVHRRDEARAARQGLEQEAPLASAVLARTNTPVSMAVGGLVVASRGSAATGIVSGDWRDIVVRPDGTVGLAVGDVSGHGVDAGIVALTCAATAHASLVAGDPLERTAALVRACLDGTGRFATCFLAVIDATSVTWLSAGHIEACLVGPDGTHGADGTHGSHGTVTTLAATGPLLAPDLPGTLRTGTSAFPHGTCLVAVTDGVVERGIGDEALSLVAARAWHSAGGDPLLALEAILATARAALRGDWLDDATAMAVCRERPRG